MPKIKVKGAHSKRTDTDATKRIIYPATQSIKISEILDSQETVKSVLRKEKKRRWLEWFMEKIGLKMEMH